MDFGIGAIMGKKPATGPYARVHYIGTDGAEYKVHLRNDTRLSAFLQELEGRGVEKVTVTYVNK